MKVEKNDTKDFLVQQRELAPQFINNIITKLTQNI